MARLAAEYGLAPIAASTHPFARWSTQQPTERERYQAIAADLAGVGRRLVICGMHVHVGIDDDELRIDLMNQARYFLPHLLVLSTSSPFAEGEDTGLKCYRLAAYQELPRTGLPGRFESWDEYRHTVDLLVRNEHHRRRQQDLVGPAPLRQFPDARDAHHRRVHQRSRTPCAWRRCTSASCACSIASAAPTRPGAAIRCSCCRRTAGARSATASTARCSISARASWCRFASWSDELLVLVREDAEALGCRPEVEHARAIVERGTSANRQIARFNRLMSEGASREEALRGVVDHLIAETLG